LLELLTKDKNSSGYPKDLGNGMIDLGGGFASGGMIDLEWFDTGVANGTSDKF